MRKNFSCSLQNFSGTQRKIPSWDREPKSLPSFGPSNESCIYSFEMKNSESNFWDSEMHHAKNNTVLSLTSIPKKFEWIDQRNKQNTNSSCWYWEKADLYEKKVNSKSSSSSLNTPSGGSFSSLDSMGFSQDSRKCLDWSSLVDNVFEEQSQKRYTNPWKWQSNKIISGGVSPGTPGSIWNLGMKAFVFNMIYKWHGIWMRKKIVENIQTLGMKMAWIINASS